MIDIAPPTEYDYKLVILGEPYAQQRHRSRIQPKKNTGTTIRGEKYYRLKDVYIHNYDASYNDKKIIYRRVESEAPQTPLEGPLKVDLFLYFPYLQQHYGSGRNAEKLKPNAPVFKDTGKDRDNCDKIILDALTGKFWPNDSRICDGRILKLYSVHPRTEIYITQLATKGVTNGKEQNKGQGTGELIGMFGRYGSDNSSHQSTDGGLSQGQHQLHGAVT